ncbi:unnamed protein product [Rotaria sp. Silwood2]|nr:unnamed protein product [Rotaria sp. Silwood2]CAF3140924.1 unnamed protein product [Rotaria sp. Silwood2]CAF3340711.1 unnamed protein product [Rotaria sp. Silwood2]CAF3892189.1 unnamed protein product [Rotaria sp. Silwood2]CAF4271492.1 unnamed protein product [Rotaria sp. Silwood2]
MKHVIFITGATGYIGINLVSKLLRQPNVERIICTTRQKHPDSFRSSIQLNSKQYGLSVNEFDLKSKIEPIELDLVKDRSSLLSFLEPYKKTIDIIHHLASDIGYGFPVEHFQPWMDVTKILAEYCMDSKHPKQFHVTGSYGHKLIEFKYTDEDFYWINGYFVYKKWLHNYMCEKFAKGLKGVLFEPGYVIGSVDPGQKYMLWRIVRMFATLEHAFQYRMLCTPIDMLIDHYMLALNHTDPGPNIICPFIPEPLNISKHMQELLPHLTMVDFERFREIVKQRLPKKAKYFGPAMLNCTESVLSIQKAIFHPLYDSTKYKNINQTTYLLSCKSFKDALKQGQQNKDNI